MVAPRAPAGWRARTAATVLVGKYCHNCIQSSDPTSVSLRDALHDPRLHAFKIDNKFVRTLNLLVTARGKLSLYYKNGIVVPYTRPLRLIFVISVSITILFALADIKYIQHVLTFSHDAQVTRDDDGYPVLQGATEDMLATQRTVRRQPPPPEFLASLERELAKDNGCFAERQLRFWKALALGDPWRDFWSKGIPFLLLGIAPFFAALLALFFRGSGYMFVNHLVFAVHLTASPC